MSADLDERLRAFRQRQGQVEEAVDLRAEELRASIDAHTETALSRIRASVASAERKVTTLDAQIATLGEVLSGVAADLADEGVKLKDAERRMASLRRWAVAAIVAFAVLAAAVIAAAGWWGRAIISEASDEAEIVRAANAGLVEAARREGERELADLRAEQNEAREEVLQGIDDVGNDLDQLVRERDEVRGQLDHLVELRDSIDIALIRHQSKVLVVVPRGKELRGWRAPGLSPAARYNGRMYHVADAR